MNRPSLRCTFFLLLLISILVTPLAGAAKLRPATSTPQTTVFLAPLGLLDDIWGFLSSLWNKEGCIIDPDGLHAAGGDAGCIIDPSGVCVSAAPVQGEEGCIIDPSGRCGG